jgi:hypothetical protein
MYLCVCELYLAEFITQSEVIYNPHARKLPIQIYKYTYILSPIETLGRGRLNSELFTYWNREGARMDDCWKVSMVSYDQLLSEFICIGCSCQPQFPNLA